MSTDWLESLEAELDALLDQWLTAHPGQQQKLSVQEQEERSARQAALLQKAQRQRQLLLNLAARIETWEQRRRQAESAGSVELAAAASERLRQLRQSGEAHWQQLIALGQAFGNGQPREDRVGAGRAGSAAAAQDDRQSVGGTPFGPSPPRGDRRRGAGAQDTWTSEPAWQSRAVDKENQTLEARWAAFTIEQELEALRRRQGQ
ncbi:MAG: hypothetical protein ERJ69_02110 [Aphanocapsa feldmannii 288cV]|nr:MAG: hypothetical protein ERJ69_02110 [Aphanocapsa feldmannii 288cV]